MKTLKPRRISQILFIMSSVLIGLQFSRFMSYLGNPAIVNPPHRPPGVEAYLPISSLINLLLLLKTGIATHVHPAGLVIFSVIIILSLMMRRGFCSWVCPIGALSEAINRLTVFFFGKSLKIPEWLDIILKSLKFYILIFFLFNILRMTSCDLKSFVFGEYNAITDAKMFLFFSHISGGALSNILFLIILTVIFKNFWCRFLCPYGAFLGTISLLSPVAVRRKAETCINCHKCVDNCPNGIHVHKKSRVNTAECMACFTCVEKCPVPDTLKMEFLPNRRPVSSLLYGIVLVFTFIAVTQIAALAGYWKSDIPPTEVRRLYLSREKISHPTLHDPCCDEPGKCHFDK